MVNYNDPDIKFHPLEEFVFDDHNSRIIRERSNKFFYFRIDGLEGLFVKEIEYNRRLGKYLCDLVKIKFNCMGFFTSDELPRYGISRKQKRKLLDYLGKKDKQLIIFLVYDFQKANQIRTFLIDMLKDRSIFKQYDF